ncbi:MAG: PIN domain-containing protein [Moraxella sp.]|nr:PIN domain-containing protein [Moraxella sp.]
MTYPSEVYLDTHAVIWLVNGELQKFGQTALNYMANCPLKISPMVKFELQYLYEIKRLQKSPDEIIREITQKASFEICQKSWLDIVNVALTCDFTRDAFDRLIVAHAMLDNSILISKDEKLTCHYNNCVW